MMWYEFLTILNTLFMLFIFWNVVQLVNSVVALNQIIDTAIELERQQRIKDLNGGV